MLVKIIYIYIFPSVKQPRFFWFIFCKKNPAFLFDFSIEKEALFKYSRTPVTQTPITQIPRQLEQNFVSLDQNFSQIYPDISNSDSLNSPRLPGLGQNTELNVALIYTLLYAEVLKYK